MRIEVTGSIVSELFDTKNGGRRFSFVRSEYKKQNGRFEEKHKVFFTVFVSDKKNLEIIENQSLQMGQRMWIEGEMDASEYTDKTGTTKTSFTIFAERICIYPKMNKGNGLDKYKKSYSKDDDDRIPF